jgi:hypothetical protein
MLNKSLRLSFRCGGCRIREDRTIFKARSAEISFELVKLLPNKELFFVEPLLGSC